MKTFIKNVVEKFKDRRTEPRYALYGSFPNEFQGTRGENYHVLPVDISKKGIGILIDPAPKSGEKINLAMNDKDNTVLAFHVKYAHNGSLVALSGLKDLKRCGLSLDSPKDVDLLKLFAGIDTLMIQE